MGADHTGRTVGEVPAGRDIDLATLLLSFATED